MSYGQDSNEIAVLDVNFPVLPSTEGSIVANQHHDIGFSYFGEGSTRFNNSLYMLTWKNGVIFKFNLNL